MAGRPRGIDDAAILRAAVAVMGRTGPGRFTLGAVAGEVGLVPGTLLQRFGSKRGMLLALAEQGVRDVEALHAQVRTEYAQPLAALRALTAGAWEAAATAEAYAHHLAFLCADLDDPDLHHLALGVQQAQEAAVRTLLDEAVAAGDLREGIDTAALAAFVQAAVTGAGLLWAVDRVGTLAARRLGALDTALFPYRDVSYREDEGSA